MATVTQSADPTVAASRNLLDHVNRGYRRDFDVRFWDGSTWEAEGGVPARFTLALKHPGALRQMFWPFNPAAFGESYIFDDFDVEGDFYGLTSWIRHLVGVRYERRLLERLQLLLQLWRLPNQAAPRDPRKQGHETGTHHSADRDKDAIHFAYNISGDFYRLFLGENMQYTCSYFASPDEDIETSQRRKIDNLCKKLRLQPGDKLLDIGCGWGSLLMHAVRHYGAEGTGVTLAGKQADWAIQHNRDAGLQDRCKIVVQDYRDMPEDGRFDKAVSVGIGEHIGRANLPLFYRKVFAALRPGGCYLHHGITLRHGTPYPPWTAFARKYVFPNGELHSVIETLTAANAAGFEVRDVESRREHYILTLKRWIRLLEENHEQAVKLYDETTYRIFRIYLAGAILGFENGTYNLYQSLLLKPKPGMSDLPLTRADWYRDQ
jgi:cyclopropane-fatty-acyl-phospholipid synthase